MATRVSVIIPVIDSGNLLAECLAALDRQAFRDFSVIVVAAADSMPSPDIDDFRFTLDVMKIERGVGFGAAANQALQSSDSPYIATLSASAIPEPEWLGSLVEALDREYEIGSCASQVRFDGESNPLLYSAGIWIARDGSSKERGFRLAAAEYARNSETLCPCGCAAIHKREMLADVGGFDDACAPDGEDLDLGMRARWAGWQSWYAAKAIIRYAAPDANSRGHAGYFRERNRLHAVIKNFPFRDLLLAPPAELMRYLFAAMRGPRKASRPQLGWFVVKAHIATIGELPRLLQARRSMKRRMT
ncbi:MAG: glycosyltransferase family 2 protein, partial [Chthoniobacterales bacterium]